MGVTLAAMMRRKDIFVLLAALVSVVFAEPEPEAEAGAKVGRDGKLLPVFQVVRFPNDLCTGSSRNGTCYTSEECSSKGGTNDGSCASGFGVCCTFALSCGSSSSDNNTYLVQTSVTSLTSPCTYTICPCNKNICRTRFDFASLTLAPAVTGTVSTTAATIVSASAIGDCLVDQMSITAPGGVGSPIICGNNAGFHMVLDTSPEEECHKVNLNIGGSTTTTRVWDIRVTQYDCTQMDSSGPPGCLQYYTQTSNIIQNYGWPTSSTVVSTTTHLSNQHYDICIRRASGYCYICYSPSIAGTAVIAQISYGLGVGSATNPAKAQISTACSHDYLDIPFANTATITAITSPGTIVTYVHRICGRILAIAAADTASETICTRRTPFVVGVNMDDVEVTTTAGDAKANVNELGEIPGGIIGFKLNYFQVSC